MTLEQARKELEEIKEQGGALRTADVMNKVIDILSGEIKFFEEGEHGAYESFDCLCKVDGEIEQVWLSGKVLVKQAKKIMEHNLIPCRIKVYKEGQANAIELIDKLDPSDVPAVDLDDDTAGFDYDAREDTELKESLKAWMSVQGYNNPDRLEQAFLGKNLPLPIHNALKVDDDNRVKWNLGSVTYDQAAEIKAAIAADKGEEIEFS